MKKLIKPDRFKLWSVGQGLFYTGQIQCCNVEEEFHFIYDCGGEQPFVEEAVNQYVSTFNHKNEIDILVISHFDNDHINGIGFLLEKIKKIRKIFIPYSHDIDSYLLFLIHIYNLNASYLQKIDEIHLIQTSNEETSSIDFDELVTLGNELVEETYRIGGVKVYKKFLDGVITLKNIWKFKFYNTELKKNTDLESVKEKISKLIADYDCSSLEELLDTKFDEIKHELNKIYEESVSGRYGNSKKNQSSLCLYHSPITDQGKYEVFINQKQNNRFYCIFDTIYSRGCMSFPSNHLATILTGDISLKTQKRTKNYDDFLSFFYNEIKSIQFFQLPHHGSIKNWNNNILEDFENTRFFLNSAGLSNCYGHPNIKLVYNILLKGRMLLLANDESEIEYIIYPSC